MPAVLKMDRANPLPAIFTTRQTTPGSRLRASGAYSGAAHSFESMDHLQVVLEALSWKPRFAWKSDQFVTKLGGAAPPGWAASVLEIRSLMLCQQSYLSLEF